MAPLVSILIPAYNAAATIGDTLKSAVRQTWPRTEIIVVDDGSRDDTRAVAESFARDGVRVFTQANQGAAAARNRALSLSSGDYIQWLDADDLISPDKVALQLRAADGRAGSRTVLSGSWGYFFHRPSRALFTPTGLWNDLAPIEWLLRKMEENVYMQTATWLVPRAVADAAGPWNTSLLGDDDGEYFCRVLMSSDGVRFVPDAKVFYRMSGSGSLSYIGHSDRKMEAQLRSMRLKIGYVRSLDDGPRARRACVTYLQNWLISFYPERRDLVEEAAALARELGGELTTPRFSWKYSGLAATLGTAAAKRAQVLLPRVRWSMVARWDWMMHRLREESL
jgi:glycosyltransferase involved in cell wall biosynthesis